MPKTVLVADHHPLFREQCRKVLDQSVLDIHALQAGSITEAVAILGGRRHIDLVLMGLSLKDTENFSGYRRIRKAFPATPIAFVSSKHDPDLVEHAMSLGAVGFLPKTLHAHEMLSAVITMLKGECWTPTYSHLKEFFENTDNQKAKVIAVDLTPAQSKVLKKLKQGLLNKQIAAELGIAECTVKAHMAEIMKKFGATNRTQVVVGASG